MYNKQNNDVIHDEYWSAKKKIYLAANPLVKTKNKKLETDVL